MTAAPPIVLRDHWECFEGIIPSVIVTAARDGTPNVSYISHVFYIDEGQVALSNQFMSKMVRNILENPRLQVSIVHPVTGHQLILDLLFDRSEASGPLFDHLALCVTAVAAHQGMDKVMRLRSADIYRILKVSCEERSAEDPAFVAPPPSQALSRAIPLSLALARQDDLGQAIDLALDGLRDALGMAHCMVFLADQDRRVLTAIASRGYDRQGAGAEVCWGEGVVGMAAAGAQTLRLSCVGRNFLYINGVKAADRFSPDPTRQIPMPGLDTPQSLLAVPMIAGGEIRGLIFAEARHRLAFSPDDTQAVELIAAQLASVVALFGTSPEPEPEVAVPAFGRQRSDNGVTDILVEHYGYDDSLFINRDYVIKGLPGRLLWRMLRDHARDGRTEFTNREFRLDASLKLPEYKDNLEARLILLGRRLAESAWPVQIARSGRGRLTLEVRGRLKLTEHD